MAVGVRTLVTCMCVLAVVIAIAALWVSAAVMAVDSLTKAREDQLASAAAQIGIELYGYFGQASTFASTMGRMYNLSTQNNPDAPAFWLYERYGDALYLAFLEAPALYSTMVMALRDPNLVAAAAPADRVCDLDGYFFGNQVAALFNASTTGNPPGCDPGSLLNACVPGFAQMNLNAGDGSGFPGQMIAKYTKFPCFVLGSSSRMWRNLPGNLSENDTGVRRPRWAVNIATVDPGNGQPQYLLRNVLFPVVGPDHAPNGGNGYVALQLNKVTGGFQAAETPHDVLVAAAAISDYNDMLMMFTATRQVMATSDVALSVEDYDDDGLLFIHQADNETAVGSRIAGIARDTFERHCTATECDWSQIARLRTIGDDLVAFAELVDPIADGLGILLVVAVSKSEILEPAKELNMNIAFISCSILLVMSVVSFVVASKLASPIAAFADRLLAASAMADLDVSHTKSRVAELALMEDALQVLVVQLLEYKSFLPASMFEVATEEEASSDPSSCKQVAESPTSHTGSIASKMRTNPNSMQMSKMTTCALFTKNVTILTTNVRGWSQDVAERMDGARVIAEQGKYISLISAGLSGKGKIDRFNGDRVLISFGSLNACSGSTACKISHEVLLRLQNQASIVENGVVGGMARGQLLVGNSGDKSVRAFNLLGPAVNISWKLADIATQYCAPNTSELLIYDPLFRDVEIEFEALPIGQLDVRKKFPWLKTSVAALHLIMRTRKAENEDEWMYQVAQLESSVSKESLLAPVLNAIFDSNIDEDVFATNRAALLAASTTIDKPAVADLLTKSYNDFADACSYTL
ncbi:hypothetical protein DIPPA_16745 [Diplonema papillatum]|nr:hypothetical protein DIPPA_16745 [Diplonema papillatum]